MKRLLSVLTAALLVASGCRAEGLQFRQDRRLEIIAPKDREVVTLPIVIAWKVRDFEIVPVGAEAGPSSGHFGVYIDATPQPPGEGLDYFFRKDPTCRGGISCLTPAYLAQRGVFETTETSHMIANIGRRVGVPKDQEDWHEVTVVLLDGRGRRIGESGDWVTLKLER